MSDIICPNAGDDGEFSNHPLKRMVFALDQAIDVALRAQKTAEQAQSDAILALKGVAKALEHSQEIDDDLLEFHRQVNHKRGFMTIQAFSRMRRFGFSRAEVQRHGCSLSAFLRRNGRHDEINQTCELQPGAKNDTVNEYSVKSLTNYFKDFQPHLQTENRS